MHSLRENDEWEFYGYQSVCAARGSKSSSSRGEGLTLRILPGSPMIPNVTGWVLVWLCCFSVAIFAAQTWLCKTGSGTYSIPVRLSPAKQP